jgi:hypothetical protein
VGDFNVNPERVFVIIVVVKRFSYAISRRRAAQNLSYQEFKLSEQSEFLNSRQIRAAQDSPPSADQVNGCTFFGSFLYASKEMNIKNTLGTTCYFVY